MSSEFVGSTEKRRPPEFAGYQADTVIQGLPPREAPVPVPDIEGGVYSNSQEFKDIIERGSQDVDSLSREEKKQFETAIDQHPEIREYVDSGRGDREKGLAAMRAAQIGGQLGEVIKAAKKSFIGLGVSFGGGTFDNVAAAKVFIKATDELISGIVNRELNFGMGKSFKEATGRTVTETIDEILSEEFGLREFGPEATVEEFDPETKNFKTRKMTTTERTSNNLVIGATKLTPLLWAGFIDNPAEFAYGLAKFGPEQVNLVYVASNGFGKGMYTDEEVAQAQEEIIMNPVGLMMLGFMGLGIGRGLSKKVPVDIAKFEKSAKEADVAKVTVEKQATEIKTQKVEIETLKKPKPEIPKTDIGELKKIGSAKTAELMTELLDMQKDAKSPLSPSKIAAMSRAELEYHISGGRIGELPGKKAPEVTEAEKIIARKDEVVKSEQEILELKSEIEKKTEQASKIEPKDVDGKVEKLTLESEVAQRKVEMAMAESRVTEVKKTVDIERTKPVAEADLAKAKKDVTTAQEKVDAQQGFVDQFSEVKAESKVGKAELDAAISGFQKNLVEARRDLTTAEGVLESLQGRPVIKAPKIEEKPVEAKPKAPIIDETVAKPLPERPKVVETGNKPSDAARNLAHAKKFQKSVEERIAKPEGLDLKKLEKDLVTAKADVGKYQKIFDKESARLQKPKFADFDDVPVVVRKLSDVKLDPKRFQGRKTKFAEETATRILEEFDPVKLDPVIVWKDAADGGTYLISGHSRYEGLTRLQKETLPTKEFKGTEAEAIHFAKVEANRLATRESLIEDIGAYKAAVKEGKSPKSLKNIFGRQLSWLESYSHLDSKGKFLDILMQEDARKSFPYLEQKARDVGELRRDFPELTNRHETQIFDAMYGETKMREMPKADFRDIIEKQVTDALWKPEEPLVFKRGQVPTTGTRARKDTGPIMRKIDELEVLWDKARTVAEKEVLRADITKLRAGVTEIVGKQVDIFVKLEAEAGKSITLSATGMTPDAIAQLGKNIAELGKSISSSTTSLVEGMKTKPEITFGVKEVLDVLIEHDRQIRTAEFTAKQLEKVINDVIPDKGRQLLVTKALEDNLQGKHWKELTDLEKAMGRFIETEMNKIDKFISDNNIVEMLPETATFRHVKHVWENEKTLKPYRAYYGKFSKSAVGGRQRTVMTIVEGEARGLVFAEPNPGKLLGLEWIDMTRAHQAREVFKTVHSIGADPATNIVLHKGGDPRPIRMVERWDLLEKQGLTEGYVRYSHPALDKTLVWKSADGKTKIFKGAVGVKSEIYPHLRAYMESPKYGTLSKLNFAAKSMKLGMSLFHPVMLGMQELANFRVPFKNIPRGLRLGKELGPEMKLLHQEGLELFKGYEDLGYRNQFFEGATLPGKAGNVITLPISLMRDFVFDVVQPGMKTSFAFDMLHKMLPKYLEGTGWTKEQVFQAVADGKTLPKEALKAARDVVKKSDGHFSGEHYKRSLLETNRLMVKLLFTPEARRTWQNLLLSVTWQREHLLVAKNVSKSFMPDKMIKKLGMDEIGPIKSQYRRYAYGAAAMVASVDLWNLVSTQAMDGEAKHIWENPEGKGFAVRAWWNEPDYTVTDKNGKERTIKGGDAYIRPLKSVFEVAEWAKDPFKKFAYKLSPGMTAIGRQILETRYQREYKGIEDLPERAKDFFHDVSTPIIVDQAIDVAQGKKLPISGILPFFGLPTSKVKDKTHAGEVAVIKDLYIAERSDEAKERMDRWNERYPDDQITSADISLEKIISRAKSQARKKAKEDK